MRRQIIMSFIAFDAHGNFLGYIPSKPTKGSMCTIYQDDGSVKTINEKEIARYDRYSLQAITKRAQEKQEIAIQQLKEREENK